jgi:hypothetical protein
MPEYDFQSLSSSDFQIVSRDLLQKKLGVVLESFGPGKDKGVDFRLRDPTGRIVVQCKHYKSLAPDRYILSLSTDRESLVSEHDSFCDAV